MIFLCSCNRDEKLNVQGIRFPFNVEFIAATLTTEI